MRYTPFATPNETDVSPFAYGTSVYRPVDDPTAWPCLNNRDAKADEVAALSAKLVYLQRMADEVGEKLTDNLDEVLTSLYSSREALIHALLLTE